MSSLFRNFSRKAVVWSARTLSVMAVLVLGRAERVQADVNLAPKADIKDSYQAMGLEDMAYVQIADSDYGVQGSSDDEPPWPE